MTSRVGPARWWLATPVLAAWLLAPGLVVGPSLDAAVFLVAGWRLSSGETPYLDVWDHKPPGIYVVHAVGELAPGLEPWTAVWALTLLAIVGTAILVAGLLRGHVRQPVAAVAGIGCTLGLGQFLMSLGGGLGESFAVLPATAGLAVALRTEPRWIHAAAAGVLIALAVVISPQLAPAALACCVVYVGARAYRQLAAFIGAGLAVATGVIAAIALSGALPAFVDAFVMYNAAYRTSTADGGAGPAFGILPWVTLSLVFLLTPALAGMIAARHLARPNRLLVVACLAWIAALAVLILVQGRLYGHYALSVVVPLAILAGVGVDDAWSTLRTRSRRRIAVGLLGGLVLLSLGVGAAGAGMETRGIAGSNQRALEVARSLASDEPRPGSMLVWGNAPYLYRLSEAAPATRYTYLYPLTTHRYATPQMVEAALAELEASPPDVIVDAGSPQPGALGFLPLLVDRPVATDGRDLDLLDPIRSFVRDRYTATGEVAGWVIYRLAEAP